MNVNMNGMTIVTTKKQDITKQPNKNEDFKKVLNNQELKKYNKEQEQLNKANNKNQSDDFENKDVDVDKQITEDSTPKDLNSSEGNKDIKEKLIKLIETAIDSLKKDTDNSSKELEGEDKSTDEMPQIQQLLQLLCSMFQRIQETSTTTTKSDSEASSIIQESLVSGDKLTLDTNNISKNNLNELQALLQNPKGNEGINSINLKTVMGAQKITPDSKSMLINNLSEIVSLLEKSNSVPSQKNDVIQNLTTIVNGNTEDKSITDNLLKKVKELSITSTTEVLPKNQLQSESGASKEGKFSGGNSSEEKFLKNLLGGDKDEMKISKAVNFMNQFETVKTTDTSKVQTVKLVIDKNNFAADLIKNVKFMELNNIKDLTVKMNPKDLGEITIKLTMESGIMKASISALNKDTYNLLNQNFQDISDKLKTLDIKIQSLDINIYEDSTFFNKDSNGKNKNDEQSNNPITNVILDEENIPISNNYGIENNQVNKFV